jgi:restriction system protein
MNIELTLDNELILYVTAGALLAILVSVLFGYHIGKKRKEKEENEGEAIVRKILTGYCEVSTAHLLNNVTLPYKDGTTQIDHILITQNGIIVIETKNYSGWIFANSEQKEWTQVKYKLKFRFQNPIFQNYLHVSAVQDLLDFIPKNQIQSLVVFTGDAEFKTDIPSDVIHLNQLTSYIDSIRLGSITENRVQFCVGRIECKRFELTAKTDVEHQKYLESKFGVTY